MIEPPVIGVDVLLDVLPQVLLKDFVEAHRWQPVRRDEVTKLVDESPRSRTDGAAP
jgi:hypothetical protein